jgi:hypothetical protein
MAWKLDEATDEDDKALAARTLITVGFAFQSMEEKSPVTPANDPFSRALNKLSPHITKVTLAEHRQGC